MGQFISRNTVHHEAVRQSEWHHQKQSLLLQLPAEILLQIANQLGPAHTIVLALTCKTSFDFFYPDAQARIRPSTRGPLLLALEKDLGHLLYYCHLCNILHPFTSSWRPGRAQELDSAGDRPRCIDRQHFSPNIGMLIGYPHARLVMNRHFLGAPHGLPLSQFDFEHTVRGHRSRWIQHWTARVINDELFLCCTHKMTDWHGTAQIVQEVLNKRSYDVCHHVGTEEVAHLSLRTTGISHRESDYLKRLLSEQSLPCHNASGSCNVCLTDYQTTIEWRQRSSAMRNQSGWDITIVSYHQLGECRSPFDPKWQAFAVERSRRRAVPRDATRYPPGSVKEAWEKDRKAT
jgi:hypothetical protein